MIDIIYEDDYLMVVNKPANMLVISAPGKHERVLTDILNDLLRKRGLDVKAHPCHRLDYETSGVIIYAKGKKIQQEVMKQFHNQAIKKKYIAFVQGVLKRDSAELMNQIEGKPAETRYRVIERHRGFTVVEAEPVTGRTNQIRIQFVKLGYPLVGERRFAFARDYKLKFRRTALHSSEINFTHPVSQKPLHFSVPLPDDMNSLLNRFPLD
ncbi:MAG: RluA family pseudouridine synthase [Planctomycetes bacterium]|nr:RluA family pseudouridine synthase [Planctomycetota bacterium]